MVVLSVRGPSLFPLFFRSLEFWVSHENKKRGGGRPTGPPNHTAHTYIFWQVGQQRELIAAKLDIALSSPSESEPSVMFHLSWGGYAGKLGALIVRLVTYYLVGGMT